MHIQIGCGQITWDHKHFSTDQILAEIARAGYAGAPAGPSGETPEALLGQYTSHRLLPAPGYYGGNFWLAEERTRILADAHRFGAFAKAVGVGEVYVAPNGFDSYTTRRGLTRTQIAGNVSADDMMPDDEFKQFAETLNAFGAATLAYGVRACFHNHVGSTVESEAEIERLLELTDPSLVFLGPDTGHLAWAGVDPVAFFRRHSNRIKTAHLKDVSERVRQQGVAAGWNYGQFTANGIFNELGQGDVDIPAILELLQAADFSGWLIVETDVTQRPTALESAQVSREYLASLGL